MDDSELKKLDFLIGEWSTSDLSFSGEDEQAIPSSGQASYHWGVGQKWLLYLYRSELPEIGMYEVHGGFTYDAQAEKYKAFAANSLGLLMIYDGKWETEDKIDFSLVHPQVQPDTRVSYTRLKDGSIRMMSERPDNSGGREIYFESIFVQR